ncbi:GreA/GreB family elongation factor [Sphingomonas sp.]|jgi:transcription elongation GreA/GreB family factor|uniref:GreA/GreB family elongation factor n=1 Tax=Sphingomonas sp. TaxID=28214 RepID=UPI002D7F6877|nr:GreA/GreB family elongation factor [Sphingomonas sp.]HEU0045267.1 GreA/GreB family elongation factor [Sphingomonas sp.]
MSVAFRRESDEEHREPRFELPIPPGPNLVTGRGLRMIEERVAALEAQLAAAQGEAREPIARDLRYWHTRAVTAVVAPAPPADEVGFGARVAVRVRGTTCVYTIVGDDEADPAAGLIAWSAPLARALMGAMEGEEVAFAGGKVELVKLG